MTKNGKFFTFLFSRSTKSRIYIKRVEISKRLVQNSLLSLTSVLGISIFGFGIWGVFGGQAMAGVEMASASVHPAAAQLSAFPAQNPTIDYSRPAVSADFVRNSGGPLDLDTIDGEDPTLEGQLEVIQRTSDPASIPSVWSHLGKINNEFGFRRNPFGGRTYEFHAGMDIDGERGDPIVAPATGVVIKAGWLGGYGNMIEIDHGNGLSTRYGHLSKVEISVGDRLSRGQLMGYVGTTGRSTGPHLHYELRLNEKPINPRYFLPPEPTEIRNVNR